MDAILSKGTSISYSIHYTDQMFSIASISHGCAFRIVKAGLRFSVKDVFLTVFDKAVVFLNAYDLGEHNTFRTK